MSGNEQSWIPKKGDCIKVVLQEGNPYFFLQVRNDGSDSPPRLDFDVEDAETIKDFAKAIIADANKKIAEREKSYPARCNCAQSASCDTFPCETGYRCALCCRCYAWGHNYDLGFTYEDFLSLEKTKAKLLQAQQAIEAHYAAMKDERYE